MTDNPNAPATDLSAERIRLECLSMAHQLLPVLLNMHQGNIIKCRVDTLSLAKRYETFVTKGSTQSADDFKKELSSEKE